MASLAVLLRTRRLSEQPVIAIVDDDEAVREALSDLLQVEGLRAKTFDSAPAFLAASASSPFACLITDVRMPEMDGLGLQQQLRDRGSSMAVIFITSSDDHALRERALLHGAAAWFTKPIAHEALLEALRAALDRGGVTP